MKIYIAASWRNQPLVELLTDHLRADGHMVISWIENNYGEGRGWDNPTPFEEWVTTPAANAAFCFDVFGAVSSDLIIYAGGGKDAAAEIGAAYAAGVPVYGIRTKGEEFGLMRKMIVWFDGVRDLLTNIVEGALIAPACPLWAVRMRAEQEAGAFW